MNLSEIYLAVAILVIAVGLGSRVVDHLNQSSVPITLSPEVRNRTESNRFILERARRRDVKQNARQMRFRVAIRCDDDLSWDDALYKTKGGPVGYWGLARVERRRVRKELAAYYLRSSAHRGPNGIWLNDGQKMADLFCE